MCAIKYNYYKKLFFIFLRTKRYKMEIDVAILHLEKDDLLKEVIQTTKLSPFTPSGNVYFNLLESIVSQQLSVTAADTIFKRFCTLFPDNNPSPEILKIMDINLLRAAGLSNQKAAYLKNVADFTLDNDLENYSWHNLTDPEVISFLTQIKGVGQWTAEMILMFTLNRPDVFPADDLGIQQAMTRLYSIAETGKDFRKKMLIISEPWRPYRTIACRYLWRWKDNKKA